MPRHIWRVGRVRRQAISDNNVHRSAGVQLGVHGKCGNPETLPPSPCGRGVRGGRCSHLARPPTPSRKGRQRTFGHYRLSRSTPCVGTLFAPRSSDQSLCAVCSAAASRRSVSSRIAAASRSPSAPASRARPRARRSSAMVAAASGQGRRSAARRLPSSSASSARGAQAGAFGWVVAEANRSFWLGANRRIPTV